MKMKDDEKINFILKHDYLGIFKKYEDKNKILSFYPKVLHDMRTFNKMHMEDTIITNLHFILNKVTKKQREHANFYFACKTALFENSKYTKLKNK